MNLFRVPYKVDWLQLACLSEYDAIRDLVQYLISDVSGLFNAEAQPKQKGKNNYAIRIPVGHGKGRDFLPCGSVSYGGNTNGALGHHVQLLLTGEKADFYYRNAALVHSAYVQRVDFAYDIETDYESLISLVDSLPEFGRIKKSVISETIDGQTCTTTYYGSRESAYFIRIYEKGKQVGQNPKWVRFEVEVKPMKTNRDFALWCHAQLLTDQPEQILFRCKHVCEALTAVFGADGLAEYQPRQEKPTTDAVRALTHMLTQYCSTIAALSETYDLTELLQLSLTVHQLRQNDDPLVRESIPETIQTFLESKIHPPAKKHNPFTPPV